MRIARLCLMLLLLASVLISLSFWETSAAIARSSTGAVHNGESVTSTIPAVTSPSLDLLDEESSAARTDQTAPPSPIAGEEELYLIIHKKRHQLHVIMNDQVQYTFPVATGRGNLTPEGEFRIVTKVHKPYYMRKKIAGGHPDNPLGTRWLGLSIDGGYKYGIHGTNRPWSIGLSASSGCIRMRNKDVEYLYRHIPLKTRVIIRND